MSSNDRELRIEYWEQFKKRLIKPEIFKEIGWLSATEPHPTGNYWQRTLRTSDVHLRVYQKRRANKLSVEVYIEHDKNLFKRLMQHKNVIEAETGLTFDWQDKPNVKLNRIITFQQVDFDDKAQWPQQFDWLIDTMLRMKAAFKMFIED